MLEVRFLNVDFMRINFACASPTVYVIHLFCTVVKGRKRHRVGNRWSRSRRGPARMGMPLNRQRGRVRAPRGGGRAKIENSSRRHPRKFGLKRFLAVRRSWRGNGVACFWATSLEKIFGGVIAIISFRQEDGCSSLPCRGVLSFRSEARETLGNETARFHHAARRRGGRMAARGARAATGDAGDRSGLVIAWAKAVEIGYYPRMIDALYSLSGFGVGLLVGMTGVGGGSLMTPLLILLFGIHPATAVGTDLLYAATTKTGGCLVHGLARSIEWLVVRRLATGSIPATMVTLAVLSFMNLESQAARSLITVVLCGALLMTAGVIIFRSTIVRLYRSRFPVLDIRNTAIVTVTVGAILGVLVSISSVGAGAVGIIALIILYPQLPMARIIGSDIA